MRTISFKNIVPVVAGVIVASVSAVPTVTPIFSTSSSDVGVTVESMPGIVTGTAPITLPSGISQAPGPVIPPTTSGASSSSTSGSFSISTASNSTSSASGTTSAPTSSTSPNAGVMSYSSSNALLTGLLTLSAIGVHLL